jgi:hypothetical protein
MSTIFWFVIFLAALPTALTVILAVIVGAGHLLIWTVEAMLKLKEG